MGIHFVVSRYAIRIKTANELSILPLEQGTSGDEFVEEASGAGSILPHML